MKFCYPLHVKLFVNLRLYSLNILMCEFIYMICAFYAATYKKWEGGGRSWEDYLKLKFIRNSEKFDDLCTRIK